MGAAPAEITPWPRTPRIGVRRARARAKTKAKADLGRTTEATGAGKHGRSWVSAMHASWQADASSGQGCNRWFASIAKRGATRRTSKRAHPTLQQHLLGQS